MFQVEAAKASTIKTSGNLERLWDSLETPYASDDGKNRLDYPKNLDLVVARVPPPFEILKRLVTEESTKKQRSEEALQEMSVLRGDVAVKVTARKRKLSLTRVGLEEDEEFDETPMSSQKSSSYVEGVKLGSTGSTSNLWKDRMLSQSQQRPSSSQANDPTMSSRPQSVRKTPFGSSVKPRAFNASASSPFPSLPSEPRAPVVHTNPKKSRSAVPQLEPKNTTSINRPVHPFFRPPPSR